jgi:hypothetical protein
LSQPFASNQFLTPAGVGSGAYQSRLQGNMKAQMIDGDNLYRTYVVGYDTRFKAADENSKNYLGIGGQFMSDQVMNGVMQSNFLALNLAYHIFLNKDLTKSVAIGFGTAFAQTTLNKSSLLFADQYDQAAGLTGNATMENLIPYPASLSANTGFLYTQHSEYSFFELGATGFFFAKPNLTYSPTNAAPETKFRYFVNMEIPFLQDYTLALHANVLNKKSSNQYYAGGALGIPLDHDYEKVKRLYLGCYYRKGEAFVPSISLISDKYIAGISYEIYNANISGANLKLSSFEFTISKSFGNKKTDLFRTIFD